MFAWIWLCICDCRAKPVHITGSPEKNSSLKQWKGKQLHGFRFKWTGESRVQENLLKNIKAWLAVISKQKTTPRQKKGQVGLLSEHEQRVWMSLEAGLQLCLDIHHLNLVKSHITTFTTFTRNCFQQNWRHNTVIYILLMLLGFSKY